MERDTGTRARTREGVVYNPLMTEEPDTLPSAPPSSVAVDAPLSILSRSEEAGKGTEEEDDDLRQAIELSMNIAGRESVDI